MRNTWEITMREPKKRRNNPHDNNTNAKRHKQRQQHNEATFATTTKNNTFTKPTTTMEHLVHLRHSTTTTPHFAYTTKSKTGPTPLAPFYTMASTIRHRRPQPPSHHNLQKCQTGSICAPQPPNTAVFSVFLNNRGGDGD